MKKNIGFLFLTTLLILCLHATSLMAIPFQDHAPQNKSQSEADKAPANPEAQKKPVMPSHHRYRHYRPFKRFNFAIETLKLDNKLSAEDVKKIYSVIIKIPPESLKEMKDKDQSVADMLYKDKIITQEQYDLICTFLKEHPIS